MYMYTYLPTHTHTTQTHHTTPHQTQTYTHIPEKGSNVLSDLKAIPYFKITFNTILISILLH